MRVLHCLAQLPARTGSGIYYRNLISEIARTTDWQQAGIFGLNADHELPELDLQQAFPVVFETPELPFAVAGMSDDMPYRSTIYHQMSPVMIELWQAAFDKALDQAKRQFQPDVIVVHHLWMLCQLVQARMADRPVIAISHGTDIRQAQRHPEWAKKYAGSFDSLSKVLALSSPNRDELVAGFGLAPEKIVRTGGAYDARVFFSSSEPNMRQPDQPVRLVHAGKLTASKGVFELVEAYRTARKVVPQLELSLIGRGNAETLSQLGQLAQDDTTISWYDLMPQAQLADQLRQSDLFVFPSYYEGLGLIALEALGSGLHLVSNRLPGLVEQLGPELARHPVITWLDMPQLQNLDHIAARARPAYIDKLARAIVHQARLIQSNDRPAFPSDLVQASSWSGLAGRLIQIIREVSQHD